MGMETKTCSKCHIAKPRDCFGADKRASDGLRSHCYACRKLEKVGVYHAPPSTGTQICRTCQRNKDVTCFDRDRYAPNGIQSQCKPCKSEALKQRGARQPQLTGFCECGSCHQIKPVEAFSRDRYRHNGLQSRCRECQRLYYAQNRARILAHFADYRTNHKAQRKIVTSKYESSSRGAATRRANKAARRARIASAPGNIDANDIKRQGECQRWRCWWCGKKCPKHYHVDHIIPIAKGGHNSPNNIVISCAFCNLSKGAKLPDEFSGRLF